MPKLGRSSYTEKMIFTCSFEMKCQIMALSYLRGSDGIYAPTARSLLQKMVNETIAELDPDERKDFLKILENVKLEERIRNQSKKTPPLTGESLLD